MTYRTISAVCLAILAIVCAGGCVVTRKTYDRDIAKERQISLNAQKGLDVSEASRKKAEEAVSKKDAELLKKNGELAAGQMRIEALQAQVTFLEDALKKARAEATETKTSSRREIQALTEQLKSARDKTDQLVKELEAARKNGAPAASEGNKSE